MCGLVRCLLLGVFYRLILLCLLLLLGCLASLLHAWFVGDCFLAVCFSAPVFGVAFAPCFVFVCCGRMDVWSGVVFEFADECVIVVPGLFWWSALVSAV